MSSCATSASYGGESVRPLPARARVAAGPQLHPNPVRDRDKRRPTRSDLRTAERNSAPVTARRADPASCVWLCTTPHIVLRRGGSTRRQSSQTSSCRPRTWALRATPFPTRRVVPGRCAEGDRGDCVSTQVRCGPAKAVDGARQRNVLTADPPGVTNAIDEVEQSGIVDVAGTGLVPPGNIGELHVSD